MNLRLDLDLYYRCKQDAFFVANGIAVEKERPEDAGAQNALDNFVNGQLLGLGAGGAKRGAGVFVMMPIADVSHENIPGPALDPFVVAAFIVENSVLNSGSRGTGKTAEEILVRYLQLNHQHVPRGLMSCAVNASSDAIGKLAKEFLDRGFTGYTAALRTMMPLEPMTDVAMPSITSAGASVPQTVTLACATAGASIYYTTDNSPPYSSNSAAQLYSSAITISSACWLRVAAQKSGLRPTLNAKEFTA